MNPSVSRRSNRGTAMTKNIRTWVIVADRGRAQLLIPDEDEAQLLPADGHPKGPDQDYHFYNLARSR